MHPNAKWGICTCMVICRMVMVMIQWSYGQWSVVLRCGRVSNGCNCGCSLMVLRVIAMVFNCSKEGDYNAIASNMTTRMNESKKMTLNRQTIPHMHKEMHQT